MSANPSLPLAGAYPELARAGRHTHGELVSEGPPTLKLTIDPSLLPKNIGYAQDIGEQYEIVEHDGSGWKIVEVRCSGDLTVGRDVKDPSPSDKTGTSQMLNDALFGGLLQGFGIQMDPSVPPAQEPELDRLYRALSGLPSSPAATNP